MTDRARILRLHNESAGRIVASIVKPTLLAGGTCSDVIILTESVLVGVALATIRLGGDEKVLDVILERAKQRLAELRLGDIKPEGSA